MTGQEAHEALHKQRRAAEKELAERRKAARAAAKTAEKEGRTAKRERPGAEQPASYFDAIYRSSDLYKREITPWSALWERVHTSLPPVASSMRMDVGPSSRSRLDCS